MVASTRTRLRSRRSTGPICLSAARRFLVKLMQLRPTLSGPPLWVVVVVAALPAGANSFLFSQRYQVAEDTVTTAIGLSTLLGLLTVPVAMTWVQRL